MALRSFTTRMNFVFPAQAGLKLSVAWVNGGGNSITEIDEGQEAFMKISVDLNGVTRDPGTYLSFTFRTPSTTEFAANYVGETQALSDAWTKSLDAVFTASLSTSNSVVEDAVTLANNGILHTWVGGGLGSIISLPYNVNELLIPRTSLNIPSEQGDTTSVVLVEEPSQGTVVGGTPTGYAKLIIRDTFVAPPGPAVLDHLTLSSDFVPVSAGSTPNVRIGEILGWDSTNAPIVLTAAAIVDSVGSMFKVVSSAGHFYLDTDTAAPSFAPALNGSTHPQGILWYFPTFSGTASAVTVQLRQRIRAEYEYIDPTGDQSNGGAGTVENKTTIGQIFSALNSTQGDRRIIVPPSAVDVFTATSSGQRLWKRSRSHLVGHRRGVFRLGRGFEIWDCEEVILQDLMLLQGNQWAATFDSDNVDALIVRQNVQRLKLKNCTLGLSCDEIMSIIGVAGVGYAESILMEDCSFILPMRSAGHTKGPSHSYGALSYFHNRNIVVNRCLHAGGSQRGWLIKGSEGFLLQNSIRLKWNDLANWGGTIVLPSESTTAAGRPTSAIIRGNFFFNSASLRAHALELTRIDSAKSEVCIAQDSGVEQNWHYNPASPSGSFQPIVVGDGLFCGDAGSTASLKSAHPFKIPGDEYGYLSAQTNADCLAIVNHVMDYSGCRAREGNDWEAPVIPGDLALSNIENYYRQQIRASGAAPTPTPMQIAEAFGSDWKGGVNNGAIGQSLATEYSGTPGAPATVGSMISIPV